MKMKGIKKFVSLLTAIALCALIPNANALTASAAEPVTYYVKYVDSEADWRFQTGLWSDEQQHRELYYMYKDIKDGDIVVVDNSGYGDYAKLEFSTKLSNLTLTQHSKAVVSAPGIDYVQAQAGSSCAITGDVTSADMYDDAGITFHSNVGTLTLIDTRGQGTGNATVAGTAAHVTRRTESGYIYFEVFNVAAGKLVIEYGGLSTDAAYYSTSAPQTPAATPDNSNEYDEVPKTGESNLIVWLFGVSALCLLGKRALKRG